MMKFASTTRLKTMILAALSLLWLAGCEPGPTDGPTPLTQDPAALGDNSRPGQSDAAVPSAAPVNVRIDNFSFTPPTITVPRGSTVIWTNYDDVPHTVTANDKSFASKALDTDDRFSHQFTAAGTYPYFCAVHTHMTGQVIVK